VASLLFRGSHWQTDFERAARAESRMVNVFESYAGYVDRLEGLSKSFNSGAHVPAPPEVWERAVAIREKGGLLTMIIDGMRTLRYR